MYNMTMKLTSVGNSLDQYVIVEKFTWLNINGLAKIKAKPIDRLTFSSPL